MESGVKQMVIGGAVINLSNLVWTDAADPIQMERSVFLVQDFRNGIFDDKRYFLISFGKDTLEDGCASRTYLAVRGKDGKYIMEPAEGYMEERSGGTVLDLLKLPTDINGVRLHKASRFRRTVLNRWQEGVFRSEGSGRTAWNMEGGNMVIFVIGANSTGKTHFIERNFKDPGYTVLNIYDYQQRMRKDDGLRGSSEWERLFQANELLKEDIVDLVRQGKDVVVEQTFFRALRRIGYVEAIREISRKISIVVYVMMPSVEQLRKNCEKKAEDTGGNPEYAYDRVKRELSEVFEFPNSAEGFSRIYEVSDGGITERMDDPDWTRIEQAKKELLDEAEERQKQREKKERREKLIQEMNHIRFIHRCEVCKKRELLTADEAYEQGWDYPPKMGQFRNFLTPRTCGNCSIADTLCFKLMSGKATFSDLSADEKETLEYIKNEPENLLPSEDEI